MGDRLPSPGYACLGEKTLRETLQAAFFNNKIKQKLFFRQKVNKHVQKHANIYRVLKMMRFDVHFCKENRPHGRTPQKEQTFKYKQLYVMQKSICFIKK